MQTQLRTNRCNNRTTVLFIGLTAMLFSQGCSSDDNKGTPTQPPRHIGDIPALSAAAEKELTFSKTRLAVVFAIDGDGKIQAFRRTDSKPIPLKFPLPAGEIAAMAGITFLRSKNPKACWMNTAGDQQCVSW